MLIFQYKVSTTVIDLVVVSALFVFMLALLCFFCCCSFPVNKDLYITIALNALVFELGYGTDRRTDALLNAPYGRGRINQGGRRRMLRRVVSENEIISRRRRTRGGLTVTPRLDVPLRSSRQQQHLLIMQPEAVYTRNNESMASPLQCTELHY